MNQPGITYTIAMPEPHTHLYVVQIDITGLSEPFVDMILPSWTPGSYLIREYARHVQEFAAFAAAALPWRKVAKDAWCVETDGAARISVRYKVYAHELTVRTSHLDGTHGYFNNATVCMYVAGRMAEPLALHVDAPEGWQAATGLNDAPTDRLLAGPPLTPKLRRTSFIARDYDELIDCPVECGAHRLFSFEVDGIEHRLAIWGRGNEDAARLVADTKRIVETQRDMFGSLPYRRYTFILHLSKGYGGLEHRNSATNLLDRWSFQPEQAYERFLGLQSHEFFHVWNVKRIRVAPLGPFDYRAENYTRQLWTMEGVTSYYDELLVRRAGLMTPERYLEKLADEIVRLQNQPGRALQSLEQSSFDTWIKLYRPDENSANTSISYYLKGSLVALLLDLEIRHRTGGERSLDDVLRRLYTAYGGPDGDDIYATPTIAEEGGYLEAVEAVAGAADGAYREFFARYIAGTDELDYARGLGHAGLQLEWGYRAATSGDAAPAWLGITCKREGERTIVASVRSDGPAYNAGVYANDELLAFDGFRVDEARLDAHLAERAPGDTVTLTFFRDDVLVHTSVTLAAGPYDALRLVRVDPYDALQDRIYHEWLGITKQ